MGNCLGANSVMGNISVSTKNQIMSFHRSSLFFLYVGPKRGTLLEGTMIYPCLPNMETILQVLLALCLYYQRIKQHWYLQRLDERIKTFRIKAFRPGAQEIL